MTRVLLLLLAFVLAFSGIPLVHSGSPDSGHASSDTHDTTLAVCHTAVGDSNEEVSAEHVHQCGVATAFLSGTTRVIPIRTPGPNQLGWIGPYTSPAFDPPERPPNALT